MSFGLACRTVDGVSLLSAFGCRTTGGRRRAVTIGAPGVVTPSPGAPDRTRHGAPRAEVSDGERTRFLALALLADAGDGGVDLARLEAAVDELVDVWTPALHTRSRHELLRALTDADDAIVDVVVRVTDAVTVDETAMVEWVASGRFVGPALLDDDVLVEPTGAVVRVAGVLTASFRGPRATRIRCYYDRLVLLEQMLHPGAPGPSVLLGHRRSAT